MSIEKIYSKINSINPKVELAQVEVKLALIADLKKNNTIAEKEFKSYQASKTKMIAAIQDAKAAIRQYAVVLNNNTKLIDEAKMKAKELGLELPNDVKKIETDSITGKSNFETITKNLQQAEKLL